MILYEFSLTDETFTATFDAILSGRPTLDELCEHVNNIGDRWYKFGVLLKLKTKELDRIERTQENMDIKVLKMLELWLDTNPRAIRKEIIDILKKPVIYGGFVAEQYLKALKESELEK